MSEKDLKGHVHDENCNHDHDHEGIELETIILTFENEEGQEEDVECGVIGIFDVEDNSYIALVVPEEEGEGDLEETLYIYRYSEEEDGAPVLDVIEDEEEFNKVNEEFEKQFFVDDEETIGQEEPLEEPTE